MSYEVHELGLAFPTMPEVQYKRLRDDIRANGLNHPIVLFEGKILDGRHRYRACIDTGIEPSFKEFSGADPIAYVTSENAARRHMTESQLAFAVAAMKPYEERKAKERMAAGGGDRKSGDAARHHPINEPGRTAQKLAERSGVSTRTVNRAIKVREHGIQEIQDAVASGEITVNFAEKVVKLNPAAQRKVAAAPKKQRKVELQIAVNRSDGAKRRDARPETGPVQPSTPFVRKLLSGLERLVMVCAEDGARDGPAIAARFLEEMDWGAQALEIQFQKAEPIFRALAIVQQQVAVKRSAA